MQRFIRNTLPLLLFSIIFISCNNDVDTSQLKDGDIIFQESVSPQSTAVQLATHSRYSHMGIIFKHNDIFLVLEAVQPVQFTKLEDWLKRGRRRHFVVKRLENADDVINQEVVRNMNLVGEEMVGKDYDKYFEWTDERIYCSELVWKIYKETLDIDIGPLKKMKDFDLSDEKVKKIMKKRYGDEIPLEETVVSPGDIFESDKLITVIED